MFQDDGDGRVTAVAIRRAWRIESARVLLEHVHEQFQVALVIALSEFVVETRVAFRNFPFVDSLLAQRLRQLHRFVFRWKRRRALRGLDRGARGDTASAFFIRACRARRFGSGTCRGPSRFDSLWFHFNRWSGRSRTGEDFVWAFCFVGMLIGHRDTEAQRRIIDNEEHYNRKKNVLRLIFR
jgi:hypothetical protein